MKILGIVGSYRKGGATDQLVSAALEAAQGAGAQVSKIYLADKHIEFCMNCRECTQAPGDARGRCVQADHMEGILQEWEASDALVLGAPVNFYNVNALTRRFMERLLGYAYWPWNGQAPKFRVKKPTKKALLITSSGMPAFFGRILTGAVRALKMTAQTMGAKPVASIFAGMVSQTKVPVLPPALLEKARAAGRKLAT